MKSVKPRIISTYMALLFAMTSACLLSLILYLCSINFFVWYAIGFFIIIFFLAYFILNYSLDKYFFQNVRIIYKNILQLQPSRSTSLTKTIKDDLILNEINRILIDWEQENKDEIVHLKELEVFRKEFLGNVSHELKTPIFTIQGYIHTLLDGGIEDQEINILYLQKAAKSIDRLISIVDDLESISKLEAGELILELRTFDIVDLVQDVIDSLELKAKENNVKLSVESGNEEQIYVYADKERVRQVFVNLLVNSIKYGKKNGHVKVNFTDNNENIIIDVSDDGIGIDKQHLPRLFERFYRVDKSRSREQGGTGLGLAIVKHIVEAHGEKIAVDSTPGIGTTFTFTLKKSR